MIYGMKLFADDKAQELSQHEHSTFSVYRHGNGYQFVVVNGVDGTIPQDMVSQYRNGRKLI